MWIILTRKASLRYTHIETRLVVFINVTDESPNPARSV